MRNSKEYIVEMNKSDQYALKVSVNERYQLQAQISNNIVQNVVFEIIKDIDNMNDIIHMGLEGRNIERQRKRNRDKKGKGAKWIWCQ